MSDGFLVAKVYDQPGRGNKLLGILPWWTALAAGEQLNDADVGSVTVRLDNPALLDNPNLLDYGNVVKVSVGHTPPVAAFEIERKTNTLIATEEGAARAVTVAGSGVAQEARYWQVFPENGLARVSPQQRVFSWTSLLTGRWFDETVWQKAAATGPYGRTYPWRGLPTGFPARSAQWIWDRTNGPDGVPEGDVYLRANFILPTAATVTVWCSIDNYGEVYIDGQQVVSMAADAGWSWDQMATGSIELPAGVHYLAVHATNARVSASSLAGAGGVLLAAGIANAAGALTKLLRVSDESWVCLGYPTAYPGWSVGDMWRQLMAEAAQRTTNGFPTSAGRFPLGFTPFADSAGQPWGNVQDWPFAVGDTYRSCLDTTAAVADWAFNADTYRFDLWNRRGQDRTVNQPGRPAVRLRPLRDVVAASSEGSFEPVNTLLLQTGDGYHETAEDGTSAARWGRREGFLSVPDQDPHLAGRIAEQAFAEKAYPQAAPAIEIDPQPGSVPWVDFGVGDTVLAPPDSGDLTSPPVPRRVMSISVNADDATGRPRYTVELDSIAKDRADRMARWLASIGHGTLGGVIAAAGRRPTAAQAARAANPYPTGAGPIGVRTSTTWTSDAALAAGATVQDTVVLSSAYTLYKVTVSGPARVRLYASLDQQAADVNRPAGTAPTGDHGLLLELSLTGTALARTLAPALSAASLDEPPSVNIPITVTNLGSAAAQVSVTLVYLATE